MPLSVGTHLGRYRITAYVDEGGMGEVYRAHDEQLNRTVAIKVVREEHSGEPEALARFRVEALAIAALNDPHICTVHDVGRQGEIGFLVMEHLEGETLQKRLARGALPLREALRVAVEVASALNRAHQAGIVHRDLKPSNVMLTRTGAKLMDFGVASFLRPASAPLTLSQLPTEPAGITAPRQIVGTIEYMAPEVLAGQKADARADIWALGMMLYQMVSGKYAFPGASTAAVLASIMNLEPRPLAELAPSTPPSLRRLIETCLVKNPESRWQHAGDLARELRVIGEDATSARKTASGGTPGALWPSIGAVLGTATVVLLLSKTLGDAGSSRVITAEIWQPAGSDLPRENCALSPDGKQLVMALPDSNGVTHLYIRRLDQLTAQQVQGTENAQVPFWSPDSRHIAFLRDGKLVKADEDGSAQQTLCTMRNWVAGGAWTKQGWILLGQGGGPIRRVKDTGGNLEPVTTLDSLRGERAHGFPDLLPDGRHFTFVVSPPAQNLSDIRVGSIDGGPTWHLMSAQHAPRGDRKGWLVYMRDRELLAQRVDPSGRRLIGAPVPMIEAPERMGSANDPIVMVTPDVLIYAPNDTRRTAVRWYTRSGQVRQDAGEVPPHMGWPTICPDGKRAILLGAQGQETWIERVDLSSMTSQPLTPADEWNSYQVWSPADDRLLYSSQRGSHFTIRSMDPESPDTDDSLLSTSRYTIPDACSRDGRYLLLTSENPGTGLDVLVADRSLGWKTRAVVATKSSEWFPTFVAHETQVAYVSDASGRNEIWVADFPEARHRTQLTHSGSAEWGDSRRTFWAIGDSIVFLAPDNLTLRSLRLRTVGGRVAPGREATMFRLPEDCRAFCPTPDGREFLVLTPSSESHAINLALVYSWRSELRGRQHR